MESKHNIRATVRTTWGYPAHVPPCLHHCLLHFYPLLSSLSDFYSGCHRFYELSSSASDGFLDIPPLPWHVWGCSSSPRGPWERPNHSCVLCSCHAAPPPVAQALLPQQHPDARGSPRCHPVLTPSVWARTPYVPTKSLHSFTWHLKASLSPGTRLIFLPC